jgi:hypothetical protein
MFFLFSRRTYILIMLELISVLWRFRADSKSEPLAQIDSSAEGSMVSFLFEYLVQSKSQTLRQACTVRPRKAPDSTRWGYIAFRYTVGSLIAGTYIHPHPPRYLGSYKSGTSRKSQKEPIPSTKKSLQKVQT